MPAVVVPIVDLGVERVDVDAVDHLEFGRNDRHVRRQEVRPRHPVLQKFQFTAVKWHIVSFRL